jgi:hypothetical protein
MYLAIPGLFLLGLGNGIWDVAQNIEGTLVERGVNRAIMPWFHAAFSGGTVLGALVGALIVALRVPIFAHMAVVAVGVTVLTLAATGPFLSAAGTSSEPDGWPSRSSRGTASTTPSGSSRSRSSSPS